MAAKVDLGIPQILPCPFCDSKVSLEFKSGQYGYTPSTCSITCKQCGIGFSHATEDWEMGRGHFSIKDKAVKYVLEKWNGKRNRSDELRSLASQLRELAEQCGAGKFPFRADQWSAHAAYEHAADTVAKLAGSVG